MNRLLVLLLAVLLSAPLYADHFGNSNDGDEPSSSKEDLDPLLQGSPLPKPKGSPHRDRTEESGEAGDVIRLPSVEVQRKAAASGDTDAAAALDKGYLSMGTPETGTAASDKDAAPFGPFNLGGQSFFAVMAEGGVKIGTTADIDKLQQQPNADLSATFNGDPMAMSQQNIQAVLNALSNELSQEQLKALINKMRAQAAQGAGCSC